MACDDPLNPDVATNDLGLPLSLPVLPASILQPPLANLTKSQLRNLHRLAAIDPPVADSDEERRLHNGLQQLVGLMDQVQAVELGYGTDRSGREKIREDLVRGFWADPEDVFDGSSVDEVEMDVKKEDMTRGRELLRWASREVVDRQFVFGSGLARE